MLIVGVLYRLFISQIKKDEISYKTQTTGDLKLSFEEMTTLLIQIEACLNSRPLTQMTDYPESLDVLTSGHFLTGKILLEENILNKNTISMKNWKLLNYGKKRHEEYLS